MTKPSKSAEDLGLVLSEPTADEIKFVLDAWTRSYRDSPWAGTVTNDRYAETQRWTITNLLVRGAKVLVATPAVGPRRIAGLVCYESPGLLHYLYVKQAFRGLGVARMLSDVAKGLSGLQGPGRFTHRTRASQWLLNDGWKWDPTPARVKDLTDGR